MFFNYSLLLVTRYLIRITPLITYASTLLHINSVAYQFRSQSPNMDEEGAVYVRLMKKKNTRENIDISSCVSLPKFRSEEKVERELDLLLMKCGHK